MSQAFVLTLLLICSVTVLARESTAPSETRPWLTHLVDYGVPVLVGVSFVVALWTIWGSVRPPALYHDEAAYLLQAQLFASGRASAAAPLLPEFFEQAHVLVTPVLSPKYPPGFAIAMVPGVWLDWPALVPLLLSGLSAGLIFALARRTTDSLVALVATLLWMAAPDNLRFRAAYFSELLSGAVWLGAWWALVRWRESGQQRFLISLATLVGVCAITRPLTALVYALPIGVVVLTTVGRERRWRHLPIPLAVGTLIVALIPLHNRSVTGSWRLSPYSVYTRTYLPFDVVGFGLRGGQPERPLPPDLARISDQFRAVHRAHTLSSLPRTLVERVSAVVNGLSPAAPPVVGILLALGLLAARGPLLFGTVTCLLLIGVHLVYAHTPDWTVYYLESLPVLAVLVALGWSTLARRLTTWIRPTRSGAGDGPHRLAMAAALLVLLLQFPSALDRSAALHRKNAFVAESFRRALTRIHTDAIVFIRYQDDHPAQFSLVRNVPEQAATSIWVAYDREDDARLLRLAPDRTPYRYIESEHRIVPLAIDSTGKTMY